MIISNTYGSQFSILKLDLRRTRELIAVCFRHSCRIFRIDDEFLKPAQRLVCDWEPLRRVRAFFYDSCPPCFLFAFQERGATDYSTKGYRICVAQTDLLENLQKIFHRTLDGLSVIFRASGYTHTFQWYILAKASSHLGYPFLKFSPRNGINHMKYTYRACRNLLSMCQAQDASNIAGHLIYGNYIIAGECNA